MSVMVGLSRNWSLYQFCQSFSNIGVEGGLKNLGKVK